MDPFLRLTPGHKSHTFWPSCASHHTQELTENYPKTLPIYKHVYINQKGVRECRLEAWTASREPRVAALARSKNKTVIYR